MDTKSKWGSVEWQKEMAEQILKDVAEGKPLNDFQKAFIDVQAGRIMQNLNTGGA